MLSQICKLPILCLWVTYATFSTLQITSQMAPLHFSMEDAASMTSKKNLIFGLGTHFSHNDEP